MGAAFDGLSGTLAKLHYSVACVIQVENRSKWPMTDPIAFANDGYIKHSPVNIQPGEKKIMSAHKMGYTATGKIRMFRACTAANNLLSDDTLHL